MYIVDNEPDFIPAGLILSFFLYRETEAAQFFSETIVFAVRVGERGSMVELEHSSRVVDEFFFGIDSHHFCQEHIMASKFADFGDLAFNVEWRLGNKWGFDNLSRFRGKVHFAELVEIASAFYATPVGGTSQSLGGEVDDKLACTRDDGMGVAFFAYRDIAHGRVTADSARPCDGQNIVVFRLVATAHHDSRERIKHIARFESHFAHKAQSIVKSFLNFVNPVMELLVGLVEVGNRLAGVQHGGVVFVAAMDSDDSE